MTNQQEFQLMKNLSKDQIGKLRSNVDPAWRDRVVRIVELGMSPGSRRPLIQVADAQTGEVKPKNILPSMFDPNFI